MLVKLTSAAAFWVTGRPHTSTTTAKYAIALAEHTHKTPSGHFIQWIRGVISFVTNQVPTRNQLVREVFPWPFNIPNAYREIIYSFDINIQIKLCRGPSPVLVRLGLCLLMVIIKFTKKRKFWKWFLMELQGWRRRFAKKKSLEWIFKAKTSLDLIIIIQVLIDWGEFDIFANRLANFLS